MSEAAETRDAIVARRVERGRLLPLIDYHSCRFCAVPRKPEHARGFATCYSCGQLQKRYESSLTDLYPVTYTTRDWSLGTGLRQLKDDFGARPDHALARNIGAVLSAYLEAQWYRLGVPWGFGIVTVVPSSRPVIAAALQRAAHEGWWAPQLTHVATAKEGVPRQRERAGKDRSVVKGKWQVDEDAVLGQDVLVLDDISTTGGTIHSFAQALRWAGANSVRAVVLARNLGVENGPWVLPLLRESCERGGPWTPAINKRDVLR